MTQEITLKVKENIKKEDINSIAKVAVDIPLLLNPDDSGCYYYLIPEELKEDIKIGSIVKAPFGNQELTGYVVDVTTKDRITNAYNLKYIYDILYNKLNPDKNFLDLIEWISKYYLTNIGIVLTASVNSNLFDVHTLVVELTGTTQKNNKNKIDDLTKEQRQILDKLTKSKKKELSYRYLLQKLKFSKQRFYQIINQLKTKGLLSKKIRKTSHEKKIPILDHIPKIFNIASTFNNKKITLNADQQKAYCSILKSIEKNESNCYLLYGVTGSGKTEIYLNLIEETIKLNKNVIYLVPEIYLIPQIFQRLVNRFNKEDIIIWHSFLNRNEKLFSVEKLASNKVKIILGARSAILAPLKNTGLIVIDEAHEASYKQTSPIPRYNAIKVAQKKAEIENCPLVLGTATPNISDYYICNLNKTILELPSRVENYPMPDVYIVDMSEDGNKIINNNISNLLKTSIKEALNKKEQIILLLNRRGYSSHVFCRACSYIQFCKNCAVPLVFHKNINLMICHHCGYRIPYTCICPNCNSPHFKYYGVGTQQLEEEVKKCFPEVKVIRVDKDQLRKKDEYLRLWNDFASGNANILIGTQLVAKGLDLPNVTVVGVILADTMLNFPDYVSYERAYQLLTQVTGRAGRGIKEGKVFIQTYQKNNPIFEFVKTHDYKRFYATEVQQREKFLYPPFSNLTRIILQSYDEKECINYSHYILIVLQELKDNSNFQFPISNVSFLGPSPCFFTKLHGKYRYHILCKFPNEKITNHFFYNLFKIVKKSANVEIIIDVDSINLL